MRAVIFVVVLFVLASCGGGSQKQVVENPYAERMKELSRNGVIAMQSERWLSAEKLFERALQGAQLANDPALIAQAWYNLGVMHISSGQAERGHADLARSVSIAERHGLHVILTRSRIALALSRQRAGADAWKPQPLNSSMPLDMHLSVARLAQLQQRDGVARDEYQFVLNKKSDDRTTLLYKVEAHMGLALLAAQQKDVAGARASLSSVLRMSREIGAPRMAAHALLLNARLGDNETSKVGDLQDALAIYQALKDVRGQRDALNELILLAEKQGDEESLNAWRARLQVLENN